MAYKLKDGIQATFKIERDEWELFKKFADVKKTSASMLIKRYIVKTLRQNSVIVKQLRTSETTVA